MKKVFLPVSFMAITIGVGQTFAQQVNSLRNNTDQIELLKAKDIMPEAEQKEEVFKAVEEPPRFQGGMSDVMKYLSENLNYPEDALNEGVQGRVVVGFIVNKDGSVSDVKIFQSLHPSCDKEAVRLVKSMPAWTPGKQNGQPVNVYETIPIRFKLAGK
jgi:protein TonB